MIVTGMPEPTRDMNSVIILHQEIEDITDTRLVGEVESLRDE